MAKLQCRWWGLIWKEGGTVKQTFLISPPPPKKNCNIITGKRSLPAQRCLFCYEELTHMHIKAMDERAISHSFVYLFRLLCRSVLIHDPRAKTYVLFTVVWRQVIACMRRVHLWANPCLFVVVRFSAQTRLSISLDTCPSKCLRFPCCPSGPLVSLWPSAVALSLSPAKRKAHLRHSSYTFLCLSSETVTFGVVCALSDYSCSKSIIHM